MMVQVKFIVLVYFLWSQMGNMGATFPVGNFVPLPASRYSLYPSSLLVGFQRFNIQLHVCKPNALNSKIILVIAMLTWQLYIIVCFHVLMSEAVLDLLTTGLICMTILSNVTSMIRWLNLHTILTKSLAFTYSFVYKKLRVLRIFHFLIVNQTTTRKDHFYCILD